MKKTMIVAIILSIMFCLGSALAGEKQLEAVWEQALPEPNDLDGWKLAWAVQADPQTWDPADEIDIDYTGGISEEYSTDFTFTSPENQRVTYVFRMRSYDTSGNKSDWTMAAEPVTIDLEPPGEVGKFSITIKILPEP